MEIHEPLELYAGTFETKHLSLVEQTFDSLAQASKVDIEANRQTVANPNATELLVAGSACSVDSCIRCLRIHGLLRTKLGLAPWNCSTVAGDYLCIEWHYSGFQCVDR